MAGELKDRIAVVTGASRGIGEAIARRFAAEGAKVFITARTLEPGKGKFEGGNVDGKHEAAIEGSLREVADSIRATGGDAIPIACDVGDPDSRAIMVAKVLSEAGHVDILVNNAAIGVFGQSWDGIPMSLYDKLFEVNVRGPFDLMRRFAPAMIERGRGWIVNLASRATELPQPPFDAFEAGSGVTLYGATKAAFIRLSAGVAAELHNKGIAVNICAPHSIVWTPGTAMTGVDKYKDFPGFVEEPVEGMAEVALAFATCDPAKVTGKWVYSTPYLKEIGREIRTLDGKDILRDWKPLVV
jgi:NAD(P)-dependent dehydrogenase (short-subunit alcohol dehydrogenase family)